MQRKLYTLHTYAALAMGLFLIALGFTGSVMAFQEEIDRLLNPSLFGVRRPGVPVVPVEQVRTALLARFPGGKFDTIKLPDMLRSNYQADEKQLQYFVDAYSGQIVGTRPPPLVLGRISAMHHNLLMGESGALIVKAAAVTLLFLLASGFYLWVPYRRWKVTLGKSLRRASFDFHLASGVYTLAFLLMLGSTGLIVAFDKEVAQWLQRVEGKPAAAAPPVSTPVEGGRRISPDDAIDAAAQALPGASPLSITIPANAKGIYRVRMRYPEDRTPIGRSNVVIDQYSGRPLLVGSSRTSPLPARTINLNRAIHTGDIFGYPTKILVAVSSLLLVLQACTGYYLWWKKRPVPKGV